MSILLALAPIVVHANGDLDSARALARAGRYPEARAALEKLVAAHPLNAAAWHELGLVWMKRGDDRAYEQATVCLSKAVHLEPKNSDYVGDYGGALLLLADRTRSFFGAIKGREAMERAVALNPDDIDAREGLFRFYTEAPFIVGGSNSKANAELAEIRRRDPDRATAIAVLAKAKAKDFAAAFALCDSVLRGEPDNYTALYQYGRTSWVSGENLEQGIQHLRRATEVPPPSRSAPGHSSAWYLIGRLEQKLGRGAAARMAFRTAAKIDPANHAALNALQGVR